MHCISMDSGKLKKVIAGVMAEIHGSSLDTSMALDDCRVDNFIPPRATKKNLGISTNEPDIYGRKVTGDKGIRYTCIWKDRLIWDSQHG